MFFNPNAVLKLNYIPKKYNAHFFSKPKMKFNKFAVSAFFN